MITIITITCIIAALILLLILAIIDLRTLLLPNKYVAGFFTAGLIFNINTDFYFTNPLDMSLGIISGAGLLLIIRHIANKKYKYDTLGLGDVKLMGAAGIWLGMDFIFLAISIGAFAGLIHGLIFGCYRARKTNEKINLSELSIPAGPGFIIGIIIVGIMKLYSLPIFLGL